MSQPVICKPKNYLNTCTCWKNMFCWKISTNTRFFYMKWTNSVVLMSIKWLNKKRRPLARDRPGSRGHFPNWFNLICCSHVLFCKIQRRHQSCHSYLSWWPGCLFLCPILLLTYRKVASSRPVYYSILELLSQRSQ